MTIYYGMSDNMIFDNSTGVQTINQEIIDWCREQHFFNDFNGIFIAIIAFGLFALFWVWKFLCENHQPIVDSVGKERCEKIAHALLLSSFFVFAGFLAWFFFMFKPQVLQT